MQTFLISKVVTAIFQLIRYELIKGGMNLCRRLSHSYKITSMQLNVQLKSFTDNRIKLMLEKHVLNFGKRRAWCLGGKCLLGK